MNPWDVVEEAFSREAVQNWTDTKESLIDALKRTVQLGAVQMFYNEKRRVVFLVTPRSPFVGHLHIFSAAVHLKDLRAAFVQLRDFIWDHTDYNRFECQTHRPGMVRLLEGMGGKLEGVSRKAFRLNDSTMIDLYNIGWVRDED